VTQEIEQAKLHLKLLIDFIDSPLHTKYVAARDLEIVDIQNRILMTPPITDTQRADVLMAHGELDSQQEMKKTFTDARVTLEARIDEMIERDNQNATETKV
jgi:hypothetical protein